MRKLSAVWCAAATIAALSACGTKEAPGPLEPTGATGRIRFVNLITDATASRIPVNPILEGLPFGAGVGYGVAVPASQPTPATANYAAIYTGSRTLLLKRTADTSVTVATFPLTIAASQDITVYATGSATVSAVTTADDNTATDATLVHLRAVNMSNGAVDVFVTAAGADLSTATPTFSNVASRTGSTYSNIAPGTYQIRTVPAGTAAGARAANVSVTINGVVLAGATGRSILIATSSTGGTPLVGAVLTDR